MILQDCRRCWGRGKVDGKPCFNCLGKGKIEIPKEQLEEHFRKFNRPTGPEA